MRLQKFVLVMRGESNFFFLGCNSMKRLSNSTEELQFLSRFPHVLYSFSCSGDILVHESGIFVPTKLSENVLERIRYECAAVVHEDSQYEFSAAKKRDY